MRHIPKIAVGIPVFNGENYLGETLKLLLAQTYEDFEIIISDNCSTDRTQQLCLDYAAKDTRILYTRTESNLGATPNFNRAFHLSRSPYFSWKAHDDRSQATYLEKCVAVLDGDPGIVLSHTASAVIDDVGNALRFDPEKERFIYEPGGIEVPPDQVHVAEGRDPIDRFLELLDETYFGTHMYGVIRREALAQTQLFRSYFPTERSMLAELALIGRFSTLDEPHFARRVHASSSCFMSPEERDAYSQTNDNRQYILPRLRAYLSAPLQSQAISPRQKAHCLARVVLATAQSRWKKLRRRLSPVNSQPSKVVYQ
jgi:glycosyltransferase involved in cell wall biosynthesis